ncbi:diguanylate cyclase [Fontimonas sp. SYSU GA230001]|uniref:sensor domain-containing diguanylate cyclase n=1 Tax=Fontimonas sp. SYSU GA230001 TaxID=3142450 RepID=UPI0032B62241
MIDTRPGQRTARTAQLTAGFVLAVGLAICASWFLGVEHYTRLVASSSTVRFNTGLLFAAAGVSLVCALHGRRAIALAAAALVAALAGLTLAEYLTGADFGIDHFFMPAPTAVDALPSGRMALNTAVSFTLASAAALLIAYRQQAVWSNSIASMLGALVMSIGLIALIGYSAELRTALQWAGNTRMALLTAVCFVALGLSILLTSAHLGGHRTWQDLPWLASATGVGLSALSALGWHAVRSAQGIAQERIADLLLILGLGASMLVAGVIAQIRHRRRQSQELARTNAMLQARSAEIEDLYERAPCGYHSLDADGLIIRMNQTELDWLGHARADIVGRKRFSELLTPASQAIVAESFPRFKKAGAVRDLELELVCRDGRVLPVILSATAVYDAAGHFLHSRSTVFDISERKRIEQALRDSEHRLQLLLDNLQTAVVVHNPDTSIRFANPSAAAILGLSIEQLLGRTSIDPAWHFVREDESPMPVEEYPVSRAIHSRAALHDYVVGVRIAPTEPTRWVLTNAIPDIDAHGRITQVVVSFIDISDRKRHTDELQQLAVTDTLTGLATRRHFVATAELEFARSRRNRNDLAVLILDLDHFKRVNDRYGHAAGDAVLQTLGRIIHQTLRAIDLAGRLGGEEFCVLLPQTTEAEALRVAERLRAAIETRTIVLPDGQTLHVTASIGVASLEEADARLTDLIGRADQAMYAAKCAGRNRVRSLRESAAAG